VDVPGPRPAEDDGMDRGRGTLLLAVILVFSGCGDPDSQTSPTPSPTPTAEHQPWSVVALGDSVGMTLPDCDGCTSFVELWADQVTAQSGTEVAVANHAIPGGEATDVLAQATGDDEVREALRAADVVVVTLGINDSPWNRLDDPCRAASDYPRIEWQAITPSCTAKVVGEYADVLEQVLAEVDELRAGQPTALRVVTVYDAVLGDHVDPGWDAPAAEAPAVLANDRLAAAQCRVAEVHGGICVDVLHAFNGADGHQPAAELLAADHTHPSPAGHEAIAALLALAGLAPLA
jgi:lysophospholipase L1-like esterase